MPRAATLIRIVTFTFASLMIVMPSGGAVAGSATATFTNGVLTIDGGGGSDLLSFGCSSGHVAVPAPIGVIACTDVTTIRMNGADGDDHISATGALGYTTLTSVVSNGGAGDDELVGGVAADTLNGGDGTDQIEGSLGPDVVKGGTGFDRFHVEGFGGTITLTDTSMTGVGGHTLASIEDVTLQGTSGADTYDASGFSGSAFLRGLGGADVLTGGPGINQVDGGDGPDTLAGGAGDDDLEGDDSAPSGDSIAGGPGHDEIFQEITGSGVLTDTTVTGEGSDTISSIERVYVRAAGATMVFGGSTYSGDIYFEGTDNSDTMTGGSGNDTFSITGGTDVFSGNGGTDELDADISGATTLGASSLSSGAGNSPTFSGIERAYLRGSAGVETIGAAAFTGRLSINTNGGSDVITGNGTNTEVRYSGDGSVVAGTSSIVDGGTTVTLSAVTRLDLSGQSGNDTFDAKAATIPTTLQGSSGDDTLLGGSKADLLLGGDGKDTLKAFNGNDKLFGEANADTLDGGRGTDGCQPAKMDTLKNCEKTVKQPPDD